MKNKYILAAGIIILVIIGGFFLLNSNKKAAPEPAAQSLSQEETVQTLQPEDIGLTFTARSDGKAVKFSISNASDITAVDYEISYLAKGDIPRGAIGSIAPKSGDTTVSTSYIDLGTCSSGKCKYDEGVSSVKLLLKITKTDSKVFQVEKSLDL